MKGKVKYVDLHADRLQMSMKALKIDGYSQMDAWFLSETAEDLARRSKEKHAPPAPYRLPRGRRPVHTSPKQNGLVPGNTAP